MIGALLDSTTVPLLQKVAAFGQRRQEVLAGNVANIDTPGYTTRDLPVAQFQQALQNTVRCCTQLQAVPSEPHDVTFQDGRNRSIEHEMLERTKNSMLHGFVVERVSAQINLLQAAISERP